MEKLQSGEDWEAWLQNLTRNAIFLSFWVVICGKDVKPQGDDENIHHFWVILRGKHVSS